METKYLIEESDKYLMQTYNRYPLLLTKGRGIKVYDADGKEYLDFVGGVAVNVLGHCHPKVVIAIQKQAQRLIHISNLYHIEQQIKLARLLVDNSFADKVFFCNSGTEAVEAAIKLARKYSKEHYNSERFEIITALNSFHGRTFGALSATGQEKLHKGFTPMLQGFKYVPFNDISALESSITKDTYAIMLEPIQGEGGVNVPDNDYLKKVKALCDSYELLLILDEVQTGLGRTGKLFAYQHYDITPDIMTLAKGLGGGVPIGALLATDKVASTFEPRSHASTFGGNPLVCASAIATIETILEDGFILGHCNRMSDYFIGKLNNLKDSYPQQIMDVRGKGLLIAMELAGDSASIIKLCMNKAVLIGSAGGGNIIRLTPPLIVDEKAIDYLCDVLDNIFYHKV